MQTAKRPAPYTLKPHTFRGCAHRAGPGFCQIGYDCHYAEQQGERLVWCAEPRRAHEGQQAR